VKAATSSISFLTDGSVDSTGQWFSLAADSCQGRCAFNTAGQREDTVNIMVNGNTI